MNLLRFPLLFPPVLKGLEMAPSPSCSWDSSKDPRPAKILHVFRVSGELKGSCKNRYIPFLLQDDYMEALTRLHITVSKAYKINPEMNFEVFIHKVDGLSDDHKIETQRDIHQRANDDLADAGLEKLHLRQVTFL